jgi:hypothetical protein
MINKKLVGRCGLYCGACTIYRAYKDSEQLRQMLAKKYNCNPEEIRCEGCQAVLTEKLEVDENWGRNCKIIKCLENKGLNFCYECDIYPECEKFHEIADFCLKYGANLIENLNKIKTGKIAEWLEAEDKKWRCKKCGKPIALELIECHWCGAKLREKS